MILAAAIKKNWLGVKPSPYLIEEERRAIPAWLRNKKGEPADVIADLLGMTLADFYSTLEEQLAAGWTSEAAVRRQEIEEERATEAAGLNEEAGYFIHPKSGNTWDMNGIGARWMKGILAFLDRRGLAYDCEAGHCQCSIWQSGPCKEKWIAD